MNRKAVTQLASKHLLKIIGLGCPDLIDDETSQEYFKRVPKETLVMLLDMSGKETSYAN